VGAARGLGAPVLGGIVGRRAGPAVVLGPVGSSMRETFRGGASGGMCGIAGGAPSAGAWGVVGGAPSGGK